ncbi:hypothetical protein N2152v2_004048 [Parachlorella kessleri]
MATFKRQKVGGEGQGQARNKEFPDDSEASSSPASSDTDRDVDSKLDLAMGGRRRGRQRSGLEQRIAAEAAKAGVAVHRTQKTTKVQAVTGALQRLLTAGGAASDTSSSNDESQQQVGDAGAGDSVCDMLRGSIGGLHVGSRATHTNQLNRSNAASLRQRQPSGYQPKLTHSQEPSRSAMPEEKAAQEQRKRQRQVLLDDSDDAHDEDAEQGFDSDGEEVSEGGESPADTKSAANDISDYYASDSGSSSGSDGSGDEYEPTPTRVAKAKQGARPVQQLNRPVAAKGGAAELSLLDMPAPAAAGPGLKAQCEGPAKRPALAALDRNVAAVTRGKPQAAQTGNSLGGSSQLGARQSKLKAEGEEQQQQEQEDLMCDLEADEGVAKAKPAKARKLKVQLDTMPLMIPAAVANQRDRQQQPHLLFEMPPGLCLEGDSGTIGRLVVAGAPAAAAAADGDDKIEVAGTSIVSSFKLDLKGIMYDTVVVALPCTAAMVRLTGQTAVVDHLFEVVVRAEAGHDYLQQDGQAALQGDMYDSDDYYGGWAGGDPDDPRAGAKAKKPAAARKKAAAQKAKRGGGGGKGRPGGTKAAAKPRAQAGKAKGGSKK